MGSRCAGRCCRRATSACRIAAGSRCMSCRRQPQRRCSAFALGRHNLAEMLTTRAGARCAHSQAVYRGARTGTVGVATARSSRQAFSSAQRSVRADFQCSLAPPMMRFCSSTSLDLTRPHPHPRLHPNRYPASWLLGKRCGAAVSMFTAPSEPPIPFAVDNLQYCILS